MSSEATVVIAAPAAEVFGWLTDPAKLAQWAGGAGGMPADPSKLAVGFSATYDIVAPEGPRPATLTVTEYGPPTTLGFTVTYAGGESTNHYRLTESAGSTTLACNATSEFAAPDLTQVSDQLAGQPWLVRMIVHASLHVAEHRLEAGAFDAQTQPYLQSALQSTLDRLAELVRPGTSAAANPTAIPSPGT